MNAQRQLNSRPWQVTLAAWLFSTALVLTAAALTKLLIALRGSIGTLSFPLPGHPSLGAQMTLGVFLAIPFVFSALLAFGLPGLFVYQAARRHAWGRTGLVLFTTCSLLFATLDSARVSFGPLTIVLTILIFSAQLCAIVLLFVQPVRIWFKHTAIPH